LGGIQERFSVRIRVQAGEKAISLRIIAW